MAEDLVHEDQTVQGPHSPTEYQARLIVELRQRLQGLPPSVVEETVQEVREHLACSQAALIELGYDPASSDLESVRRFGDIRAFVRNVLAAHKQALVQCRWLPWLTFATIVYVIGMAVLTIYDKPALWAVPGIAVPVFLTLSWRARDFQWKGLCKATLPAMGVLSLALGLGWVDLRSAGGVGEVPRWQVAHYRNISEEEVDKYPAMLAACDDAFASYLKGRVAIERSSYFRNGQYLAYRSEFIPGKLVPEYLPKWVTDFEQADLSWRQYSRSSRLDWQSSYQQAQWNLAALEIAPRTPFHLKTAGEGFVAAAALGAVAVLLNFFVVVLRGMFDRIRSRPRRAIV